MSGIFIFLGLILATVILVGMLVTLPGIKHQETRKEMDRESMDAFQLDFLTGELL